jgi:hypothetical protein
MQDADHADEVAVAKRTYAGAETHATMILVACAESPRTANEIATALYPAGDTEAYRKAWQQMRHLRRRSMLERVGRGRYVATDVGRAAVAV